MTACFGDQFKSNNFGDVTVIKYFDARKVLVMFNDGYTRFVSMGNLKSGTVKNPNKPSVFGVGINDMRGIISSSDKVYQVWYSMIRRCYSDVYHEGKPSYVGVEVCEKWKRFSGFYEDVSSIPNFSEMLNLNWELDKDIFSNDGKIYSLDTCCFLPKDINTFFSGKVNKEYDTSKPKGVYFNSKLCKYVTSCKIDGKRSVHLGVFDNVSDARAAYVKAKKVNLNDLVLKHKDLLNVKTFEKLMKTNIDDW